MHADPAPPSTREAQRQAALVAALFGAPLADAAGVRESGERRRRGLSAYRANAESLAERALAATCPTVAALLGDANFARLAQSLWRTAPPRRGDLAQWGGELPRRIEAERDLDPWPFLADVARLDLAVHACEAAGDPQLDQASLALLADHEPGALRLRLAAPVRLVASPFAIASIRAAHRRDGGHDDAALRTAIDAGGAEQVVVARSPWRAEPQAVDAATWAWMRSLDEGRSLADALDAAARAGTFDFEHWLVQALPRGWLARAEVIDAQRPTRPEEQPR